jgi:hypothetical protein
LTKLADKKLQQSRHSQANAAIAAQVAAQVSALTAQFAAQANAAVAAKPAQATKKVKLYCHTHGNCGHSSADREHPGPHHQVAATKNNKTGGKGGDHVYRYQRKQEQERGMASV